MLIGILIIAVNLIFYAELKGQVLNPAYEVPFEQNNIATVKIDMAQVDLNWMLDKANWYSDVYKTANFKYYVNNDSVLINNIGFRLRGNTSRQADKKSFKVKFGEFAPGTEFYGLSKLNLKGAHNDPLVMREHISFRLLRAIELPATRTSHVKLYVNNEFMGVYLNIEQIDKRYLKSRFANKDGNLYKCFWGADLTVGNDAYDNGLFELETNKLTNDRSDLENFLDVLNNSTFGNFRDNIYKTLNVEGALKYLAVEVLIGHWDGYVYNKNNFYLYQNTATGKMEVIPYDVDNTLGVDFIGRDWTDRNIYTWSRTNESRPLFENLLVVDEFYKMYTEFVNQFITNYYNQDYIFDVIDSTAQLIRPALVHDTYYSLDYGFSISDFDDALKNQVANHVPWGIKPFISLRNASAAIQINQQALGIKTIVFDQLVDVNLLGRKLQIESQSILPIQVKLFDANGRMVNQAIVHSYKQIVLPNSGLYLVQVRMGNEVKVFKKVAF